MICPSCCLARHARCANHWRPDGTPRGPGGGFTHCDCRHLSIASPLVTSDDLFICDDGRTFETVEECLAADE